MRELKCRIGDLAIVTKCGVPERIGLLVRVVARADAPRDWLTDIQGTGVVARGVVTGKVGLRHRALMNDWNLTPIRGDELIDEEEKREEIHE
ncbi:hypothetical protein [Burkholderia cenocepacia]|uniref:hypothetical protein n=1 Tax=Burkholderia cenocepacia TaxID=95486 RepID=UPI002874022F|nr:hypothetical protein [Burkholderia cenocepacia]MDS0802842.1 hypothetical protein [Burkholderia cenocepacia]